MSIKIALYIFVITVLLGAYGAGAVRAYWISNDVFCSLKSMYPQYGLPLTWVVSYGPTEGESDSARKLASGCSPVTYTVNVFTGLDTNSRCLKGANNTEIATQRGDSEQAAKEDYYACLIEHAQDPYAYEWRGQPLDEATKGYIKGIQSEAMSASLWSALKDTTWRKDDDWAGEGYVFYEDEFGLKKCIFQIYGSGLASVYSEYVPITIIDTQRIKIGSEIFTYQRGQLVGGSTTLTLYADKPIVFNKTEAVDMKMVSSKDFDIRTLDQSGK